MATNNTTSIEIAAPTGPAGGGTSSGNEGNVSSPNPPPPAGPLTPPPAPNTGLPPIIVINNTNNPAPSPPNPSPPNPSPPNSIPLPPNNGADPTPFAAGETATINAASLASPAAGQASKVFFDGSHIGNNFVQLGAAAGAGETTAPFNNQMSSDLVAFLNDWNAAQPSISQGLGVVPGGSKSVGLTGEFVVNVIKDSFGSEANPSPQADQAFGGALGQYFNIQQHLLMNVTLPTS